MTAFDGTRYPSSLASALKAACFRAATHSCGGECRRCRSLLLSERRLGTTIPRCEEIVWANPNKKTAAI